MTEMLGEQSKNKAGILGTVSIGWHTKIFSKIPDAAFMALPKAGNDILPCPGPLHLSLYGDTD